VDTRGRTLAIDYGEKNIGLACSDDLGITVRPLPSIPNSGRKDLVRALKSVAAELGICRLVVGIPLNMDGSRNDSVRRTERLMRRLQAALDLPLVGVDERLSSVEAAGYWNRMSARQKKKYRTLDSLAAALILERYMREY